MIIKVHCHRQEYWAVARATCECGEMFKKENVGSQQLPYGPDGHVDVLSVRCHACGRDTDLRFDISSFVGKPDLMTFRKLLSDPDQLWKIYTARELLMETVLKYLADLAANRDTEAIRNILDEASHFLAKTSDTRH